MPLHKLISFMTWHSPSYSWCYPPHQWYYPFPWWQSWNHQWYSLFHQWYYLFCQRSSPSNQWYSQSHHLSYSQLINNTIHLSTDTHRIINLYSLCCQWYPPSLQWYSPSDINDTIISSMILLIPLTLEALPQSTISKNYLLMVFTSGEIEAPFSNYKNSINATSTVRGHQGAETKDRAEWGTFLS